MRRTSAQPDGLVAELTSLDQTINQRAQETLRLYQALATMASWDLRRPRLVGELARLRAEGSAHWKSCREILVRHGLRVSADALFQRERPRQRSASDGELPPWFFEEHES